MKNKLINVYGIAAFLVLVIAVVWFTFSVSSETHSGSIEAERSFSWISKEAAAASFSDGFMTDSFVHKLSGMCQQSRLLSALVISTPSGTVYAWPEQSPSIRYDMQGKPVIANTSLFMKVYSANLDIGDGSNGAVVMTAVLYVLHPDAIFAASRNSFLVILALLFVTLIIILAVTPGKKKTVSVPAKGKTVLNELDDILDDTVLSVPVARIEPESNAVQGDDSESSEEIVADSFSTDSDDGIDNIDLSAASVQVVQDEPVEASPDAAGTESVPLKIAAETDKIKSAVSPSSIPSQPVSATDAIRPEGLFSPVTGIGWEQYLSDRLEAELVRAASSEQDLSLIVIRVSGLLHTDLLSRKISQVLLDTFKFRDLVFEFGSNGFAGILQNINLDQAMKIADTLYAGIDSLLMEMSHEGQITVGITTRTARLLPAARMIEEAVSAARKAEEEPSLPIVAFRANPEKYRNFVAENN